jgi:hypothetical protein
MEYKKLPIKRFDIKINDLQPFYFVKVVDANKNAVDLSGAIIVCTMKDTSDGTLKINRQSSGITISDQDLTPGEFNYQWQAGDTDTAGKYLIEFEITPVSAGKYTIPSNDIKEPAYVYINDSLDTV